jgi:hypothetical protein
VLPRCAVPAGSLYPRDDVDGLGDRAPTFPSGDDLRLEPGRLNDVPERRTAVVAFKVRPDRDVVDIL